MSADIRLDPATLRYLLERVPVTRESCEADYLGGYRTPHEVDVFRHGMATVHNVLEASLRALMVYAEAGRPPLSDWIRACEGTALWAMRPPSFGVDVGQPTWSGYRAVTLLWDALRVPYAVVRIRHDGGACLLDTGRHEASVGTPAELRAALDRLAAEARP